MERVMTVEEKIKRAEEIYQRRRKPDEGIAKKENTKLNKKDIKLLKKMIIQILICTSIYLVIHVIHNNQYGFSEEFINKINDVLAYDTNFKALYFEIKNKSKETFNNIQFLENNLNSQQESKVENQKETTSHEETNKEDFNAIGGAEGEKTNNSEKQELTQTEEDILEIQNTTNFIKPIEGTITSKFGQRDTATGKVPKNHTGIDIAANIGTKIKSSTNGEVVISSEEGDYGKHLKIQIGEVSIIYAHCNNLYVKQGDKVIQGQEIAEVGSTGNSTGSHLHFEIRYKERVVNPQNILEL